MNKVFHSQQTIRFRHWSRKGYAMFGSVGKCVTIGNLKKGIVDVSLEKQMNVCTLLTVRQPMSSDDDMDEEVTDIDTISKLLLSFVQPQQVVEGGSICFNYLNRPKGCVSIFSAFFVSEFKQINHVD